MYGMSNVPGKDLKYSLFYVRSVDCSWVFSDLNQNGCAIVRATVTLKVGTAGSRRCRR